MLLYYSIYSRPGPLSIEIMIFYRKNSVILERLRGASNEAWIGCRNFPALPAYHLCPIVGIYDISKPKIGRRCTKLLLALELGLSTTWIGKPSQARARSSALVLFHIHFRESVRMAYSPKKKSALHREPKVTLKTIAEFLDLTPGTVSAALNNSSAARPIPERTKKRILAAAKELNYRPNYFARSLRLQRTFTIGVIAEEIGDAYGALVISGIEEYLRKHNFFFLTVIHRHDQKLLQTYSQMLLARGVEGFITLDTSIKERLALPTVAVSGHENVEGVTNITLNHHLAAKLALSHLAKLGHQEIAFLKGASVSSDAAHRWTAICNVAEELGIRIRPELVVQIDSTDSTPGLGYPFAKQLLERKKTFTALL